MHRALQLMLHFLAAGLCVGLVLGKASHNTALWQLVVGGLLVLVFAFHVSSALWIGADVPAVERLGVILHGLSFAILGAAVLARPHPIAPWLAIAGGAWLFLARRLYELALPPSRSS